MKSFFIIFLLCAAIAAMLGIRALIALRREKDAPRGSEPGTGYHVIEANYHSGGGGGGHSSTFRVPKDPQEYARAFVPKNKD